MSNVTQEQKRELNRLGLAIFVAGHTPTPPVMGRRFKTMSHAEAAALIAKWEALLAA